jgi:hypothetical protein
MAPEIHTLKASLKHGPSLSREGRAEFLLCQTDSQVRQLKPETLAKLRVEVARLARSANPKARQFAQQMKIRYPGLAS